MLHALYAAALRALREARCAVDGGARGGRTRCCTAAVGVVYLMKVTIWSDVVLQRYPLRFRLYCCPVYGPAEIVVRTAQLLAAKHHVGRDGAQRSTRATSI